MEELSTRIRARNDKLAHDGPVLYWMQREQRVQDNWALLYAQEQALKRKVPLLVVFNIPPSHPLDTWRLRDFMLRGLKEVASQLEGLQIPFTILSGHPKEVITSFIYEYKVGEVVGDFNPLRFLSRYRQQVADAIDVSYLEVDAHNIVPCWIASEKEEFAAHTFRPKIHRQLKEFLVDFPQLKKHPHVYKKKLPNIEWTKLSEDNSLDRTIKPVDWIAPGAGSALAVLNNFVENKLAEYDTARNNPNVDGISNLSPYLRHGQIAPQRVALKVQKAKVPGKAKEAFLEELIVRRELTDNYCFYNKQYDKVAGAHAWAQKTIEEHVNDKREYTYTFTEFESAKTHDELWNAMQLQMVETGKMHGWCRMYWAKKILEWTKDVQTAIDTALDLNDKYELDGCDPNGVVGVMWSICGVHDRAWTERPIFGKIRYMNFNGAKRKFSVQEYIDKNTNDAKLFD